MADVVIRVTEQGPTGNAVDKAADGIERLGDEAKKASPKLTEVDGAARGAGRGAKQMGDQFDKSKHDADQLKAKLIELKASAIALGQSFAASGGKDMSILKEFNKATAEFGKTQRAAKILNIDDPIVRDPLIKSAKKLAEEGASTFASFFQGGVLKALRNPRVLAAAAPAAVGALIGTGAIIGGAVNAGAGLGVAGAGVAGAAAQSKKVQDEWAKALSEVKKQYLDATTQYEGPAIAAIQRVSGAIKTDVNLKQIFTNAVQFVEPVADSIAKAVVSIGHGFESLTANAMPAVVALSNGIEDLGDATGDAFKSIGDGSEGGAQALGDFIGVAADLIRLTGAWIGFFEDSYKAINDTIKGMRELNPLFDLMATGVDKLSGKGEIVSQLSGELDHSAAAARGAYGDFEDLSAGMYNTADAADELDQRFRSLFDVMMTQDEANLRVKEGFLKLKEELLDGKKTLDQNTEAGQRNVGAIFDQIKALDEKREADIAAGNGTKEATETANRAYAGQVESLRLLLIQMGFNRAMVDDLIAKYSEIPAEINTNINTYHNDYYARQGAGGTAFDAGDRLARRGIDKRTGGIIGAFSMAAAGGIHGGLTKVGEEGWEFARLPTGTMMYPHANSVQMEAQAGQAGGASISVALVSSGSGDPLVEVINNLIRTGRMKLKVVNSRVVPA